MSLLTVDDFLALPDEPPYREFVKGDIWQKPPAGPRHSATVVELIGRLGAFLRRHPFARLDVQLTHVDRSEDRVYLPDVSVTLLSRFPRGQRTGPVEVHPDLAIEVLSPDDRADRVQNKVQFYLRSGVTLVWVVDPDFETVTVYRPDGPPREFRAPETASAGPVLPGFALGLGPFFATVRAAEEA